MILPGSYFADSLQPTLSSEETKVIKLFHQLYSRRYRRADAGANTINLSWFGHHLMKCPLDLWIYLELLVRTCPDIDIETGTFHGGSALYFATILDHLVHGRVLTIVIEP